MEMQYATCADCRFSVARGSWARLWHRSIFFELAGEELVSYTMSWNNDEYFCARHSFCSLVHSWSFVEHKSSLDVCKTLSKVFQAIVLVHAHALGVRRSEGLDLKLCNCSECFKVEGNKTIINLGISHLSLSRRGKSLIPVPHPVVNVLCFN